MPVTYADRLKLNARDKNDGKPKAVQFDAIKTASKKAKSKTLERGMSAMEERLSTSRPVNPNMPWSPCKDAGRDWDDRHHQLMLKRRNEGYKTLKDIREMARSEVDSQPNFKPYTLLDYYQMMAIAQQKFSGVKINADAPMFKAAKQKADTTKAYGLKVSQANQVAGPKYRARKAQEEQAAAEARMRQLLQEKKEAREAEILLWAVMKLQAWARGRQARKGFVNGVIPTVDEHTSAAVKYKNQAQQQVLSGKLQMIAKAKEERRQMLIREKAAIFIQRMIRGRQGRYAAKALREKKRREQLDALAKEWQLKQKTASFMDSTAEEDDSRSEKKGRSSRTQLLSPSRTLNGTMSPLNKISSPVGRTQQGFPNKIGVSKLSNSSSRNPILSPMSKKDGRPRTAVIPTDDDEEEEEEDD